MYNDLVGKHPVELIYAWLVFFYIPLLVVLVSANRISDDIGSGSIRYVAFRSSRFTWSFGKFLGQAGMIGAALLLSGIGAYAVALVRLHGTSFELLSHIFHWSLRAWIYSIPYLGLAMGLSHLTRSGSKATILGILSISGCFVISTIAHFNQGSSGWKSIFVYLATVVPDTYRLLLWRSSAASLATGTTWMMAVAGFLNINSGSINLLNRGPFKPEVHCGRISILPQDSELPGESYPLETLVHYARLQGLCKNEAVKNAKEILAEITNKTGLLTYALTAPPASMEALSALLPECTLTFDQQTHKLSCLFKPVQMPAAKLNAILIPRLLQSTEIITITSGATLEDQILSEF